MLSSLYSERFAWSSQSKTALGFLNQELEEINNTNENSLQSFQTIYLELLEQQRRSLNEMNRISEFDEELIRKYLSLIDIEEFKIREKQLQKPTLRN
jgi:monovalent cation/hydrogen antiporter